MIKVRFLNVVMGCFSSYLQDPLGEVYNYERLDELRTILDSLRSNPQTAHLPLIVQSIERHLRVIDRVYIGESEEENLTLGKYLYGESVVLLEEVASEYCEKYGATPDVLPEELLYQALIDVSGPRSFFGQRGMRREYEELKTTVYVTVPSDIEVARKVAASLRSFPPFDIVAADGKGINDTLQRLEWLPVLSLERIILYEEYGIVGYTFTELRRDGVPSLKGSK